MKLAWWSNFWIYSIPPTLEGYVQRQLSRLRGSRCEDPNSDHFSQTWSLPPHPHISKPPSPNYYTYTSVSVAHGPGRPRFPGSKYLPAQKSQLCFPETRSVVFKETPSWKPSCPESLSTGHSACWSWWKHQRTHKYLLLLSQPSYVHLEHDTEGSGHTG